MLMILMIRKKKYYYWCEYRKRPCTSRTFFHKIEVKNQGCGLSMDTSVFRVPKNLIHSPAQLFAVTSDTIFPPRANSWVLAREMADCFVVFLLPSWQICRLHYQAPIRHDVFCLLQVSKHEQLSRKVNFLHVGNMFYSSLDPVPKSELLSTWKIALKEHSI